MSEANNQKETFGQGIKKMFSLKADSASNEEIRTRLLDGGQVPVRICAYWYVLW